MARPRVVLGLVALMSPGALADPAASVVEPGASTEPAPEQVPAASREPTAADVADAPLPGSESGRTDAAPSDDTTARQVGRDLLFFPKLLTEVVLAPARGGVWAYDRFHLADRYYRWFFNDARTIGLYPTGSVESGFGINGVTVGARFVDRDLLGQREHLAVEAALGVDYHFKQLYALNLRTGDRLGHRFHAELDAGYEVRPRDPFYGIGNGTRLETPPPAMINPLTTDTAVATRFSQHRSRARITGDIRLAGDLSLRPAAAVLDRSFGEPAQGTPTDAVYEPMGLVGWMQGVTAGYGEAELRWDSRHAITVFEKGLYSAGTLAGVFGGYESPFSAGAGSPFFRYGGDVQQFIRIGQGPRVLLARVHGEAITGSLDQVPFTELPAIGGPLYLRGYDVDRFRDRIAAFGTLHYAWDLASTLGASTFVDAGRVWHDYSQLTLSDMRVGFGGSLVLNYGGGFVSELSLASSIDGGFFASLSFNPVYDIDERVRRR